MEFKNKQILTVFSKPELLSINMDKEVLFKDYTRYQVTNILLKNFLKKESENNKRLNLEYNTLKINIPEQEFRPKDKEIKLSYSMYNDNSNNFNLNVTSIYNDFNENTNEYENRKIITSTDIIGANKRIRRKKHELERKFLCKVCGNSYGSYNNMQQHVRLKHY